MQTTRGLSWQTWRRTGKFGESTTTMGYTSKVKLRFCMSFLGVTMMDEHVSWFLLKVRWWNLKVSVIGRTASSIVWCLWILIIGPVGYTDLKEGCPQTEPCWGSPIIGFFFFTVLLICQVLFYRENRPNMFLLYLIMLITALNRHRITCVCVCTEKITHLSMCLCNPSYIWRASYR